MLTNNFRHSMPGLGIGFVAFSVYALYDQTMGASSKKGQGHH